MYILSIFTSIKKMSINETIIIEYSKENSYYSMKLLKKAKIVVACKQINTKKYLILVMLKNTINH